MSEKINLGIIVGCIPCAKISGTSSNVNVYPKSINEMNIITPKILISFIIRKNQRECSTPVEYECSYLAKPKLTKAALASL